MHLLARLAASSLTAGVRIVDCWTKSRIVTGGAVFQREAGTSLSALFEQALDEFWFELCADVYAQGGQGRRMHSLTVRMKDSLRDSLKDSRPRLRWRTGYEGG